jgi:hypothetical protein
MTLEKQELPRWADATPPDPLNPYFVEPDAAQKNTGWLSQQKPPYQYMNWIHIKTYERLRHFDSYLDILSSIILQSDSTLYWSGSVLSFLADINVYFVSNGVAYANTIDVTESSLTLSDGEMVVCILTEDNVNFTKVAYVDLEQGMFCETSTIAENTDEREIVLFRRRGSYLEIPILKKIIQPLNFFKMSQETAVPVGAIIDHYDYNGALPLDTTHYKYCDGSTHNFGGAVGTQTLPDLSNRYTVGFGTEGGGDIDTAVWAITVVGNASHQINLQHDHTMPHTHDTNIGSFTSGSDTHNHGISGSVSTYSGSTSSNGSHAHELDNNFCYAHLYNNSSSFDVQREYMDGTSYTADYQQDAGSLGSISTSHGYGIGVTGLTDSDGSHTHTFNHTHTDTFSIDSDTHSHAVDPPNTTSSAASSSTTSSSLSTTQSIQPRSIRVRKAMRVA